MEIPPVGAELILAGRRTDTT